MNDSAPIKTVGRCEDRVCLSLTKQPAAARSRDDGPPVVATSLSNVGNEMDKSKFDALLEVLPSSIHQSHFPLQFEPRDQGYWIETVAGIFVASVNVDWSSGSDDHSGSLLENVWLQTPITKVVPTKELLSAASPKQALSIRNDDPDFMLTYEQWESPQSNEVLS